MTAIPGQAWRKHFLHSTVPKTSTPSAYLVNNFSGGTQGTTITAGNSGGLSGNAFDTVTLGAGSTLAYDNTYNGNNNYSARISSASNHVTYGSWSSSITDGTVNQLWYRLYVYLTNYCSSGSTIEIISVVGACSVYLSNIGALTVNNASGSTVGSASASIPLNSWVRIEGTVTGRLSTGQLSMSLYLNPDSIIPASTISSSSTNTGGGLTAAEFGILGEGGSITSFNYWFTGAGVSTIGPLGPVLPDNFLSSGNRRTVGPINPGRAWRKRFGSRVMTSSQNNQPSGGGGGGSSGYSSDDFFFVV